MRFHVQVFLEHANKLVEVANLACSMSGNEDGVKMVRYAASQIEALCPQVINAARILAARPRSRVAQDNMDTFRDAWENQVITRLKNTNFTKFHRVLNVYFLLLGSYLN